jgi:hypothetical protein
MGRAFIHLLVITVLSAVAFTMFANINFMGQGNRFMDWAQANLPTIMMQGRTMSTDAQEPFFATYDEFNLNFVFSTKQAFAIEATPLSPNTVVFEANRLLYVLDNNAYEEYTFDSMTELPENLNIAIDAEGWGRIKAVLNKWFFPIVLLFVFLFTLVAYFIAAVINALIGLIIALIVKTRLAFGALLSIAIYSLTLLNLIVIAGFFVPFLAFPFRGIILLVITLFYVTMAILVNKAEMQRAA